MERSYGWVVVGAGMLMTCIGIGAMFSLAVFLQPIATDTGWSRSGISTAATLDFLSMGAAAFLWGALSDRFGTRIVVLLGSALLGVGLVAASQATSLIEFQLLFGVVIGVAAGSFYAPMVSVATAWLEHRRNLAVALVSAGMGIGSMTISPIAGLLLRPWIGAPPCCSLASHPGRCCCPPHSWCVRRPWQQAMRVCPQRRPLPPRTYP